MTRQHPDANRALLALDELLLRDDLPEIRDALSKLVPVDYQDQLQSAADDTSRGLETLAAILGGTYSGIATDRLPGWVRLGLLSTFTRWTAGRGSTCMHAPRPDRPQPVHAAAWRPGLVVCSRCSHLLRLRLGSDRDRTCDGCGSVTGVENCDAIFPSAVQLGLLTFAYGVCSSCKHWPDPE